MKCANCGRALDSASDHCAECDAMFEADKAAALDGFVARCVNGGASWTSTLADVARFLLEQEGREPTLKAVGEKCRELGWRP